MFFDTYSKVATAKLYDRKATLVAADTLNDRVLPFFEEHGIRLLRVLADRETEYCDCREHHEYELYLILGDIDHSRTKAKSPQTNGRAGKLSAYTQHRSAKQQSKPWSASIKSGDQNINMQSSPSALTGITSHLLF